MTDLHAHRVDICTIGQYLRPSRDHLPISKYYSPVEFARFKQVGDQLGFGHVEAGPLVRSSYHADEAGEKTAAR
jgi:lipoic acid synthetase